MPTRAPANWSLRVGRWRGVELRVHLHAPLLALVVLLLASIANTSPLAAADSAGAPPMTFALIGLGVLAVSVLLHEVARAVTAERVGGRTNLIVLGPIGGWTPPQLPSDPPAHLVTAISGPMTYLAILVGAGCALAAVGDVHVLRLLNPFEPNFDYNHSYFHQAAQLAVWINACLLLVNLLPIDPCDGAHLLRGVLWPLVGRASAAAAQAHICYGSAAVLAVFALVVQQRMVVDYVIPAWFPLATLSVLLLYGGNRAARQRQYDVGISIDELESDDEQWLAAEWIEEERTPVLVEQLHEKQQETLDRKRREREVREDARVDDILARLQTLRFEQLSEEEQAILKRASRRYRQRRRRPEGEDVGA